MSCPASIVSLIPPSLRPSGPFDCDITTIVHSSVISGPPPPTSTSQDSPSQSLFSEGPSSQSSRSQSSSPQSSSSSQAQPGSSSTNTKPKESSPASSSAPKGHAGKNSKGLSAGAKAGIGVGVTAAAVLALVLLFFLYRRRRKGQSRSARAEGPYSAERNEGTPASPNVMRQSSIEGAYLEKKSDGTPISPTAMRHSVPVSEGGLGDDAAARWELHGTGRKIELGSEQLPPELRAREPTTELEGTAYGMRDPYGTYRNSAQGRTQAAEVEGSSREAWRPPPVPYASKPRAK